MSKLGKKNLQSDLIHRTYFLEHRQTHERDDIEIYTDVSKKGDTVSEMSPLSHPEDTKQLQLPNACLIYTAELYALWLALTYVLQQDCWHFTIYTDSRSALQGVQQLYSKNPLVTYVQQQLERAHTEGKTVHLCWIPSHCGIYGNDLADTAATNAYLQNSQMDIYVPFQDKISNQC